MGAPHFSHISPDGLDDPRDVASPHGDLGAPQAQTEPPGCRVTEEEPAGAS